MASSCHEAQWAKLHDTFHIICVAAQKWALITVSLCQLVGVEELNAKIKSLVEWVEQQVPKMVEWDYEEIHLIDLHPTADAEIETKHSTLILSCFAPHHYICLSVESKEFFLKSFEIRIYYDDLLQLQEALSILIEYQDVISTENDYGFISRLLDVNFKIFWQSGLVLGEEVTRANLLNGHPVIQMNW